MLDTRFKEMWENLQGKKPHLPHFLSEVYIAGIRGIEDLRVSFDYPVSVIAGGNASGKTTVLFAAACAYKVPNAGVRDFVPSTFFPGYHPKTGQREDERREVTIEFDYSTPNGRLSMRWHRDKGWNRSFMGRRGATQPERPVYVRTLSNLSNPAEVRGVLSMSNLSSAPQENRLTASQIEFAQQMLPFRYSEVVDLSSGKKNLLFAAQEGGAAYSEFHMAAGERAILRLSQEIAQLKGALVLIDEVEAGLHPWVQQVLMLQLQQLALRNDLQIIVTSHSPVVLDSVPTNGRIFLDRDVSGNVSVRQAYRDVIQNALYGRSSDALNVLCEDVTAEGILDGIFDILRPKREMQIDSIRIGRDTGADSFPTHAAAFAKFGQVRNFVFVLDGDQRNTSVRNKILDIVPSGVSVLFLPGQDAPEVWIWEALARNLNDVAADLAVEPHEISGRMAQADSLYDFASSSLSDKSKSKLRSLASDLQREPRHICRTVARIEVKQFDSDIQPLVEELENAFLDWRGR